MLLGDQIRIMDLLPCEDGNDKSPIVCVLRTVALSDHPEFDALSYCWGVTNNNNQQSKDSDTVKKPWEISGNLHAALRRLRLQDRKRQLWVDQICIDQANTDEKISQVRMMNQIYSACRCCIIWFGDLKDGSTELVEATAAVELIECVASKNAKLSWDQTTKNFQRAARGVHSMSPECHPWWQRIWTFQEAVLPPRKSIFWGPLVLSWQSLTLANRQCLTGGCPPPILRNLSAFACPRPRHIGKNCLLNLFLAVGWIDLVRSNRPQEDLLLMVMRTRSLRDASQPQDKILGMLGLLSPQHVPNTKNCNYGTKLAQVYSAATLDMILARRSLLPLLMNPRIGERKGTADIPRWAIDLAHTPDHWTDYFYQYWGYGKYNACAGRALDMEAFQKAMTEQPIQHRALGLKGILVDTVNVLSDNRLLILESHLNPETQNLTPAIPRTLRAWCALAKYQGGPKLDGVPDHELRETFSRLILGDYLRNNELWVTRRPDQNDIRKVLHVMNEKSFWRDERSIWPNENILYSQICNQTFFVTQGGKLGIGHLDIKAGDEVWVFDGGNVPFIVRKRDEPSTFDFVGRCYVQGIMNGEALKDRNTENSRRTVRLY